jgi:hypothetical protein
VIYPDSKPLNTENNFPDCVFLKLHSTPVKAPSTTEMGFQVAPTVVCPPINRTDLKITIRFGKQAIKSPGGQVEFGLKRGALMLKLENSRMPLETVALKAEFAKALEVEEQQEKGRTSEANVTLTGGIRATDTNKITSKTKRFAHQVANRGTEEAPIWEFQAQLSPEHLILLGHLTEEPLGILEHNDNSCALTATFSIQNQNDIHLFDSNGIIAGKNLSRNKTALLTREFFLRFIAPKLQPYLSQVEGQL